MTISVDEDLATTDRRDPGVTAFALLRRAHWKFTVRGGLPLPPVALSSPEQRRLKGLATAAKAEVTASGYASVAALFTREDLEEAQRLVAGVFDRFAELRATSAGRAWAFESGRSPGRGRVEQPEILYLTMLEPRLRETALFRTLCLFAAEFGLNRFRFDHAILKVPNGCSETAWHQDAYYRVPWLRNRTASHASLHVWIPFQDSDIDNGCMEFVPGSHRQGLVAHEELRRGADQPGWIARGVPGERAVACPVAAGGFTLHTPLTLHRTGANRSAAPRLAWICHFDRIGAARALTRSLAARLAGRGSPAPAA